MKTIKLAILSACIAAKCLGQIPVTDAAANATLKLIDELDEKQLTSLKDITGVSKDQLTKLKEIKEVIGEKTTGTVANYDLSQVQAALNAIKGMDNAKVAELFPSDVGGAFLGKSFADWKETVTDPSKLYAQELRRKVLSGMSSDMKDANGNSISPEKALADVVAGMSTLDRNNAQSQLSMSISKLFAARYLDNTEQIAQQVAALTKQRQVFDENSKQALTLLDRSRLNNNQQTMSLELQAIQLQQQVMGTALNAMGVDAQTNLLEMQIEQEEVARALKSNK